MKYDVFICGEYFIEVLCFAYKKKKNKSIYFQKLIETFLKEINKSFKEWKNVSFSLMHKNS